MKQNFSRRIFLKTSIFLSLILFVNWQAAKAQGPSVYYKNFVKHSDNSFCQHTPPATSFTAFLNSDQSRILIETSPRWDPGDPNIAGNGTFGIELGNFINPVLAVGDSVFVRFTCNETGEQAVLSDEVTGIPWYYFPANLVLASAALPSPPQNVAVERNGQNQRQVTWDQEPGMTYDVYRTNLKDTVFTGTPRRLYTRIAEDVSANIFSDTTTTDTVLFGYIVYAVSAAGVISSHSSEAVQGLLINGLTVTPGAKTSVLRWNSFTPPLGKLDGYNIYRRTASGTFSQPIAYSGTDTFYVDSRLALNTEYFYKLAARIDPYTEFGESEVETATTLPSQNGLYTYANLKVAVVIYKNTNGGTISNGSISGIQAGLRLARLFYWRNSGMKLNLEFTWYPIDEYKDFGNPNDLNVQMTVDDLADRGVMNTQYDIIFRITPATAGYWSIGVSNLALPGPYRQTGFSQSTWPVGTGVVYPANSSGVNYGLAWVFTHECQHALDALYNANGRPEMYHGDAPWEFPVACGEQFDFQAKMFRDFQAYESLLADWGDIYEATDADGDGFPDSDPSVALDESRFGSLSNSADSDGDGLSDKKEAMNGDFAGSNPVATDTDGDSIPDGQDAYPRYPLLNHIPQFTPVVDGTIENGWTMLDDEVIYTSESFSPRLYMAYSSDSLYLALNLPVYANPRITLDFHNDGWWHSSGNTALKINPANGTFSEFRSWDASNEVKAYSQAHGGPGGMWDNDADYQQHFHRRVIYPDSVHMVVTSHSPGYRIELAIPRRAYAGLSLHAGDHLKLNINYERINNNQNQWACTFDQYDFASLTLGAASRIPGEKETPVPLTFYLLQNYPNPFNPETEISFSLPHAGKVRLIIYNNLGQALRTLLNGNFTAGLHRVKWDGTNSEGMAMPSGIYFYRLTTSSGQTLSRKMILMR
jgi:hypothetical protein